MVIRTLTRRRTHAAPSAFSVRLAAARSGERWAFDELFTEWNRPMIAFVRARGVADPEEVVNDVFLGVFRHLPTFEGSEADFRSWIFTIARNKIADRFRHDARRPPRR